MSAPKRTSCHGHRTKPNGLLTVFSTWFGCVYNSCVNQILAEPEHKGANILYIAMNVCGIFFFLLSVVLATAILTSTDIFPLLPFAKLLITVSFAIGPLFSGLILCAGAQILRYTVCIYAKS